MEVICVLMSVVDNLVVRILRYKLEMELMASCRKDLLSGRDDVFLPYQQFKMAKETWNQQLTTAANCACSTKSMIISIIVVKIYVSFSFAKRGMGVRLTMMT